MKKGIFPILIVMLALAACGTADQKGETAPNALQGETPGMSETSQPPPTSQAGLQVPFYFISQGQIWRSEDNGQNFQQITHEREEIIGMDVSPVDGALAYVSSNQLILTDADGNNRRILIEGTTPPSTRDVVYIFTNYVSSPAWSPDGLRLAYGLNGVNVITLSDGQVTHLLDNNAPPSGGYDLISIYEPRTWTLDGKSIFVRAGTTCQLLSVEGGVIMGDSFWGGNCEVSWSNDAQSVFAAESGSEYTTFGVWQIDASTGTVTTLLTDNEAFSVTNSAAYPKQSPDGSLYFFYRSADEDANPLLVSAPLNDMMDRTPLETITLDNGLFWSEALWAPDASFVILSMRNGPMHILPTDDSPSITFPISASNLRWGMKK